MSARDDVQRPAPAFRGRSFPLPMLRRLARVPRRHRRAGMSGGPGRARPIAAAALLAALTGAWLVAAQRGHAGAVPSPPVSVDSVAPQPTAPQTTGASVTGIPVGRDCGRPSAARPEARPEARCVIDGVTLHAWVFPPGTVAEAYHREARADAAPRSGPPLCARGVPDERAWSTAASPALIAGRYRCRFEHGRAAMWWTHANRLTHAVASDGDLAGLFAWWRAHPLE
jgi:hypothetical protein